MRFRGLPAEMHVGIADLTPLGPCSMLSVCPCCNCVNPSFSMCVRNHAVCQACIVSNPSATGLAWCPICEQQVPVTLTNTRMDELNNLQFRSKCGFEGTLKAIRAHLLTDGIHRGPDNCTNLATNFDFEASKQSSKVSSDKLTSARSEFIREARITNDPVNRPSSQSKRGDSLRRQLLRKRQESIKDSPRSTGHLGQVATPVADAPSDAFIKRSNSTSETTWRGCPTTRLWFDVEAFYKMLENYHTSIWSHYLYVNIGVVPIRVAAQLKRISGDVYLNIFTTVERKRCQIPLNVKMQFFIGIHDLNGAVVASESYVSSEELCVESGTDALVTMTALHKNNCLIRGNVQVSIKIRDVTM